MATKAVLLSKSCDIVDYSSYVHHNKQLPLSTHSFTLTPFPPEEYVFTQEGLLRTKETRGTREQTKEYIILEWEGSNCF
jgi:hypothetical protein